MASQKGYIALEGTSVQGPFVVLVAISFSALMAGDADLTQVSIMLYRMASQFKCADQQTYHVTSCCVKWT